MKMNSRKRMIMMALALSLTTSGCARDNYKDNGYAKIEEIMSESEFYQKEIFDETYEERYSGFYQSYYDHYIKYMNEKQYNELVNLVTIMNEDERYDYPNIYRSLNDMFGVWEGKYGCGFYASFNARILTENISIGDVYIGPIAKHVNTLRFLVDNDEEFFKSVYSCNANNVVDCIAKYTGCKNKTIIEELFYMMDTYYILRDSEEYMDQELKKAYENRVIELIGELIKCKSLKDKDFNNTLYARLLNDSAYLGGDKFEIVPYFLEDTFYLQVYDLENDNAYRMYDVKSEYLYQDITFEELKRLHVNQLLENGMNYNDEYYGLEDVMQLLFCIVGSENLNINDSYTADEIRLELYENLNSYFKSEDEFNTFVLRLYDSRMSALDEYFELFIKRLEEKEITYEDFIRYNCLVNYNETRKYVLITYQGSFEDRQNNYVPEEELKKMKESEYENLVWTMEDNYFIGTVAYYSYFERIDELLANNDLGFSRVFNPDSLYTWEYGKVEASNLDTTNVLSVPIKPKFMEYNGSNVVYYEIPEYYENAQAVELFPNVENTIITRKVDGFKTTIIDPDTGENKLVYVSALDETKDEYESIYFMTDYKSLYKAINGTSKVMPTGGKHE